MFNTVLVANRGEIARRVIATCRRLGLATVAVHSDPDGRSRYVAEADRAVRLPGASPSETYLDTGRLLAAATAAGADAVHPGYGFRSEDPEFATAVLAAGLAWIGPPAAAMAEMADKVAAKRRMAAAGVPVLPELDPERLRATELPVLIKAAAGGGGRGMRVVTDLAQLPAQLAAARAEAGRSFGDDRVFCEPYLAAGHHLEVQLLADSHGVVWAVGERECSIQRRHQKVIEEAPSPLADRIPGLRQRLASAAVAAARAIDYRGAGTVEFIVDDEGNCFFLEMNTRLQVEHPVTEAVTGLDLVEWQLRIAAGQRLPAEPPPASGHAIEARIYAEDPSQDWRPQTGTFHRFAFDPATTEFTPGPLRLDAGIGDGDTVSAHYDALLAKLISHDRDRDTAARRLAAGLRRAQLHGPVTNRDQLVRVLTDPQFEAGRTTTAMLDRPELARPLAEPADQRLAAVAAALTDARWEAAASAGVIPELPSGWRNVYSQPQSRTYLLGDRELEVRYRFGRSAVEIEDWPDLRVMSLTPSEVAFEQSGVCRRWAVARAGEQRFLDFPGGSVRLLAVPRFADPAAEFAAGTLLAPLPGAVLRVAVQPGQPVGPGEPLLWIEAMKMEHPVLAGQPGTVREIHVAPGQQVAPGDLLISLDESAVASTPESPSPS